MAGGMFELRDEDSLREEIPEETRFTIDDKEISVEDELPPMISNAIKVLDVLPYGQMYSKQRLASAVGVALASMSRLFAHPAFQGYFVLVKKGRQLHNVCGSRETIAAYKEWKSRKEKRDVQ